MNEAPKTCLNCQFCRKQEEGYSAFTVVGYQADCMFGLNSFNSDDTEHDVKADYANRCPHFTRGIALELYIEQVDGVNDSSIQSWILLVTQGEE